MSYSVHFVSGEHSDVVEAALRASGACVDVSLDVDTALSRARGGFGMVRIIEDRPVLSPCVQKHDLG